jgi:hypothetical protein
MYNLHEQIQLKVSECVRGGPGVQRVRDESKTFSSTRQGEVPFMYDSDSRQAAINGANGVIVKMDPGVADYKMLFILFAIHVHSVICSRLLDINPCDDDPKTKYYLMLGCWYLGHSEAVKYESTTVQDKLNTSFIHSCMLAIWPGHFCIPMSAEEESCLRNYGSFRKGDVLTYRSKRPFQQPERTVSLFPVSKKMPLSYFTVATGL